MHKFSLYELLRLADRRRRARVAFRSVGLALWPAFAAAIFLAGVGRLWGVDWLMFSWPVPLALGAVLGAAFGFEREDLLAAALELDRLAGLDAALTTGIEVHQGYIRGPFAEAVAKRAENIASGLQAEIVSILPQDGLRYLSLPVVVLAGLVLIPSVPVAKGDFRIVLPAGGIASGRVEEDGSRRPAARLPSPKDSPERASPAVTQVEQSPRQESPRISGKTFSIASGGKKTVRKAPAASVAARAGTGGEASQGGRLEAVAPGVSIPPVVGRRGELDLLETASFAERFPQYEELIRRYFTGPWKD